MRFESGPRAPARSVQGRPVYIQHVGSINMKKMYELTTEERMLKFHVQVRGIQTDH